MLRDEFQFFIANQDALVRDYPGRVVVIKDGQVVGDYDDELDACLDARRRFEPGTFLVQACEPGPSAYTVTISSHELVQSAP